MGPSNQVERIFSFAGRSEHSRLEAQGAFVPRGASGRSLGFERAASPACCCARADCALPSHSRALEGARFGAWLEAWLGAKAAGKVADAKRAMIADLDAEEARRTAEEEAGGGDGEGLTAAWRAALKHI